MVLASKLDFHLYLENVQSKVNKTIELFGKLQNILQREWLVTICYLLPPDYRDIICNEAHNSLFHKNIKST